MVVRITTTAFEGVEAVGVDVQVQATPGLPQFQIVGLADKAVSESRERVRAALHTLGIAMPPKRLTVNLAPADLPKEGSHYDLPIALAVLGILEVIPGAELAEYLALGELALDGQLRGVNGVLPSALLAQQLSLRLLCPQQNTAEAVWVDADSVLTPDSLAQLVQHFRGTQVLAAPTRPQNVAPTTTHSRPNLIDVKGQESAKRALEIAAAGGHNMLMVGPPGAGKSMLAARLPSILPPLSSSEILDVSVIASLVGDKERAHGLSLHRPYRAPHHSASAAALSGGGRRAQPGEITLAHRGVLFLDELPEFSTNALEALRQPIETGTVSVARAERHVTYPARFQLIAAMNPCKCGLLADPARACRKAPLCGQDYQKRLSGPLLDRFDIRIELSMVSALDLANAPTGEDSATVAARVLAARHKQTQRYSMTDGAITTNAEAQGQLLETFLRTTPDAAALLAQAAEKFALSARGYTRILRVARTIADLDPHCGTHEAIARPHLAEALALRMAM